MRHPITRLALAATVLLAAVPACIPVRAQDARLPFVSDQAAAADPDVGPIFGEIRKRGGQPLNMHRAAANAPKAFKSFVEMAYALRFGTKVPRQYRELMILRATQLEGGEYEFTQHRPMAMSCGVTAAQLAAIGDWQASNAFDPKQRAVLALADGMATKAGPDDAAYAQAAAQFTPEEIVELVMTAGFYVMTARLTKAGHVPLEPGAGSDSVAYGRC